MQLLRTNFAVRIASYTAVNWFNFPQALKSKTSIVLAAFLCYTI
jgi:hypothetical protein